MEEKRFTLEVTATSEDILGIFENDPLLKRAFETFWKKKMETWIEKTANPAIAEAGGVPHDMHYTVKRLTMKLILKYGLQRLVESRSTSSFSYCLQKAIEEDEEEIVNSNQKALDSLVKDIRASILHGELLSLFLLDD